MSTIGMIGTTTAMDGQKVYNAVKSINALSVKQNASAKPSVTQKNVLPDSAEDVLKNLETSKRQTEEAAQELQRLSDMVNGNKLQFSVNKELDRVIISVVDSSTNEVIKQIPSEDLQRIQIHMKHVIGLLFDEII